MQAFMWQEDSIGIAKCVNACLHKMSRWKFIEGPTSDQPGVAGKV